MFELLPTRGVAYGELFSACLRYLAPSVRRPARRSSCNGGGGGGVGGTPP